MTDSRPSARKALIFGSFGSFGTIAISIATGLASVPIGLHYFGPARYGIWMLISSVLAYLSLSRLGIDGAAAVLMAKTTDPAERRAYLGHALRVYSMLAALLLAAMWPLAQFSQSWQGVFGAIAPALRQEAADLLVATIVLFLLRLPTTAFTAAFVGMQQTYWERFYVTLNTLVGFLVLVVVVGLKGTLYQLVLLSGLASLALGLVAGLHLWRAHPDLRLHADGRGSRDRARMMLMLTSGLRFFSIGVAAMVVWNTDNIVISHFLGVEAVAAYAVTFKLFSIGYSLYTMVVSTVLGPVYGRASGEQRWDWIQEAYSAVTGLMPMLGGLLWLGGVAFASGIIQAWAGPQGYAGMLTVTGLGLYGYLLSLVNSHATLLNGINATKRQVWIGWAEATANLVLSVILVGRLGVGGVALGTALASLLTVSWMLPLDLRTQTQGRVTFQVRPVVKHLATALVPGLAAAYGLQLLSIPQPLAWGLEGLVVVAYLSLSWWGLEQASRRLVTDLAARLMRRVGRGEPSPTASHTSG